MSKEEIFNYFFTNSANFGVKAIGLTMLAGLVVAALIFLTYWITNRGVRYSEKFNISLVVITLISIVIMLMISSNIVISLGMVGALSIVRFRTAIKDSRDTVFIFWAISEGLCVGSQNFKLGIITTLFIAIVFLLTSLIPKIWNKYLLVITGEGKNEVDISAVNLAINPFVIDTKLRTVNKDENHIEMIIEVRTRGEINASIVNEILKVKGIKSVNYIVESGENVG
ncbi:MAG: DUF4956 domain-containing protein [Clostridia bacterium]|nr:DUF4956 domain-containing protein [Clostridia bacterium]